MEQSIEVAHNTILRKGQFNAPMPALPLDTCRLLTGVVCACYFVRTLLEARDISDLDGLIDHQLSFEIFPFTSPTLFGTSIKYPVFVMVFLIAVICSFGLILGYRSKLSAAILYVIAVSTYRWNFLVMYVDDAIVHLMLFWMLLLPIGGTLAVKELMADRTGVVWEKWKHKWVPGGTARCFLLNIALIYVVAGSWKWTSPMWREGTAIAAIMQLPVSYAYESWRANHLWLFGPLNFLALAFEPLFPLLCLLRTGKLKYALGAAFIAFHVFIIFTMKLPFANLLCLASMCVLFRGELMRWLSATANIEVDQTSAAEKLGFSTIVGFSVVVVLAMAMLTSVNLPDWRQPITRDSIVKEAPVEGLGPWQRPFFVLLWSIGLAQQYQLMNWIDDRNYLFSYSIIEYEPNGTSRSIDPKLMFPMDMRNVLLQSYIHGIVWMAVPNTMRNQLQDSLKRRYARRFCRIFDASGEIQVNSTIERITGKTPRHSEESQNLLMTFTCHEDKLVFTN